MSLFSLFLTPPPHFRPIFREGGGGARIRGLGAPKKSVPNLANFNFLNKAWYAKSRSPLILAPPPLSKKNPIWYEGFKNKLKSRYREHNKWLSSHVKIKIIFKKKCFFTRISSFLRTFEEFQPNEWKSCFFFPGCIFFFGLKNLMNEWQLNFSEKKNNTQKHTKIQEKKHNPHLLKKWEFLKIRMNG